MKHWLIKDGDIPLWFEENAKTYFSNIELLSSGKRTLGRLRLLNIIINHLKYFSIAIRVVLRSKNKDIIVCFLDLIGLYMVIVNLILFRKRKVLIVNLMINDNSDIFTRIKRGLYKRILKQGLVYSTVNTESLQHYYQHCYNFDMKRSYVLHDSFSKYSYLRDLEPVEKVNEVFVGGVNARDLELVAQVAMRMPKVTFKLCLGNAQRISGLGPNVISTGILSLEEFIFEMRSSKITWIPIKSNSAAGIIVLLQSGLLSIPVITTRNLVIPDYVNDGVHGVLVEKGDVSASMKAISKLLSDAELSDNLAANFYAKIIAEYKPEIYFSDIYKICHTINEDIIYN